MCVYNVEVSVNKNKLENISSKKKNEQMFINEHLYVYEYVCSLGKLESKTLNIFVNIITDSKGNSNQRI